MLLLSNLTRNGTIVRFAADPDAVGERDGLRYGTTADLPLVGVDSHSHSMAIEVIGGSGKQAHSLAGSFCKN